MPCHGVAVMRRQADAWVNATQVLKVAGFDKPQRTRVLEREVQRGTHEKVQGGYGKYQGASQLSISLSPELERADEERDSRGRGHPPGPALRGFGTGAGR